MIISTKFVNHGFDIIETFGPCAEFEQFMVETMIDCNNAKRAYEKEIESLSLKSFITESSEDNQIYIEAGNNLFAKIGNAVIAVAKKFNEMCDQVIQKIKDIVFQTKTSEAKMKKLVQAHPELSSEKIRDLAAEGGLNFADIRSFAELDREFYKLIELANSDKCDMNTFKGKCKTLENKIKNNDTKFQTAATVAKDAALIVGIGTAIIKFRTAAAKQKGDIDQSREDAQKISAKLYDGLKKAYAEQADKDGIHGEAKRTMVNDTINRMGKFELLARMHNIHLNKKNQAISHNIGLIQRVGLSLAKSVDTLAGSKAVSSVAGDVHGNFRDSLKEASKKARENHRK